MQYTSTVTSKGTITIPAEIRKDLGISQGSRVSFLVENGAIAIQRIPNLQELRAKNKAYLQKIGSWPPKQMSNDFGLDLYMKDRYGIK